MARFCLILWAWILISINPVAATAGVRFDHVVVVILENAGVKRAMSLPEIRELTSLGVTLESYFAIAHPSQPNYIALIAGSTLNVDDDKLVDLNASHLGDLLESKGLDWRVYAEDYPGGCFLDKISGLYSRRHVPFLSFTSVQKSSAKCDKIQNALKFGDDFRSGELPAFSLYIPNNLNNGHDRGLMPAGTWLRQVILPLAKQKELLKRTLLVVTFDEGDDRANQIVTVLIGAGLRPGQKNKTTLNHFSLLRLIEEEFKLGTLGRQDGTAIAVPASLWN